MITELLKKQYPNSKIIESTQFRVFDEKDSVDDIQKLAKDMKAAGCQAAIVGNAG